MSSGTLKDSTSVVFDECSAVLYRSSFYLCEVLRETEVVILSQDEAKAPGAQDALLRDGHDQASLGLDVSMDR